MWDRFVGLMSRLRFAAARRQADDAARRELEAHLELLTSRYIRVGMTPDVARHAARSQLGSSLRVRDEIYDMNSIGWVEPAWSSL